MTSDNAYVSLSELSNAVKIEKNSRIFITGSLSNDGNVFYNNSVDNCFIQFDADSVEIDGF